MPRSGYVNYPLSNDRQRQIGEIAARAGIDPDARGGTVAILDFALGHTLAHMGEKMMNKGIFKVNDDTAVHGPAHFRQNMYGAEVQVCNCNLPRQGGLEPGWYAWGVWDGRRERRGPFVSMEEADAVAATASDTEQFYAY